MSNRERIIDAAIELFNSHGAATVGTNKIAQHLSISPGNLYYHFKNKQDIIRAVFDLIQEDMARIMIPPGPSLGPEVTSVYLLESTKVIWKYRFFYADLVGLLQADAELQERFVKMRANTLNTLRQLYKGMIAQGAMTGPNDEMTLDALVYNSWIVATSWVRYLQSYKNDVDVSQSDFDQGNFQIFSLLMPYMSAQRREEALGYYLPSKK